MNTPLDLLRLLPLIDWLALAWLFVAWVGYATFAKHHSDSQPSLLELTNRIRRQWMLQATYRDNRVVDGVVVQNLSTSPSFFASTTILIIGGLLAVLGTSDKATELVREIPFAARTTALVFDMKLVLLAGIFVYSFFRFTWSLRQYGFGALMVASAPEHFASEQQREAFAERAGRVMGLAAETFNDGLRGYYMSFAVMAWFFSPIAFIVATAAVVWVLYWREFKSDVLELLRDTEVPREP